MVFVRLIILVGMNTKILKRIKFERYFYALIMILFMVGIAELSGEKEIIFPEIVALTIGAWIAEKQPWTINKRKLFFLMTLASVFGVLVVRYLHIPLLAEVLLCFAFTGIALTLTRTTLLPIISACILPIYLNITSWVYPLSVGVMSLMIIFLQWIMEKRRRPKNNYVPCVYNYKIELKKWAKLMIALAMISLIPFKSQNLFFIAPPLIVAFAEFSNVKSPVRKHPYKIFAILVLAAVSGTVLREVLNLYLHLPLTACAVLACVLLFATFERVNILFPPAGAILLLPLILNANDLMMYPVQVTIGSLVFIVTALLLFREKSIKVNSDVISDSAL